jgi:toxin ParE1/3/4
MPIEWTPRAHANLDAIRAYIAQESPEAADALVARLLREIVRIAGFPRLGRVVPEFGQADIREIIVGSYRVIYHAGVERILILAIRHGAQRLRRVDIAEPR